MTRLALLAFLFAALAQGGGVTYHKLNLGGEAQNGVFAEDLSNTGRPDLIGLASGRFAIFRNDPAQEAGYLPTPEVIITGSTAYFLDVADILPEKGKEVLVLSADGISCFAQDGGRFVTQPRSLIQCNTILSLNTIRQAIAAPDGPYPPLLPWNFAFDVNGDKRDDILVPNDNGTDVYLQKAPGQFAKPIKLKCLPVIQHYPAPGHRPDEFRQATSRSPWLRTTIRPLESRDVNGDGRPDIVSGHHWFAHKIDGSFDPTPANLPADLQKPVAHNIRQVDLNGDGKPDIFEEKTDVTDILHILTRAFVFLADKDGRVPRTPTQVIVDQNVLIHANLPLHDFDGDGALDFAMYKTDITVTEIAKWIRQCFGQIEGNLNFYLFDRASDRYPRSPAYTKPISMRFKVDAMEAIMGLVWERYLATMMRFEGDYNGDGRLDLLVREKTEQISIYFNSGNRRRLFSRDPDIVLDGLPAFHGLALNDLNADRCTDLLLYSGDFDHVVAVYVSKKQ